MDRMFAKKIKDCRGTALINVMVTLVVVSVFLGIIASIFAANLRETNFQKQRVKAYYLALSGSDLCYAALVKQGVEGGDNTDTMLYERFSKENVPNIASTPTLTVTMDEADGLVGGTATVTISAFDKNGLRWVKIKSTARLTESTVSNTTTLDIQVTNPLVQIKS